MPQYLRTIFTKKNTQVTPQVRFISLLDDLDFKQVAQDFAAAAKNPEIAGIILLINNNGGHAGSFSVLHDMIKKITVMKPVISLIASSACSGGYMIASAADYIIAHSCSDIGCIGVYNSITRYKNPKQKNHIEADMEVEIFSAGEFKTYWNEYAEDLSQRERMYVQSFVDTIYKKFLDMVAKNRNLDLATYKEWAEGKIFLAEEALSLGLIDEIGTIFQAETKMLELIKLKNPTMVYAGDITLVE